MYVCVEEREREGGEIHRGRKMGDGGMGSEGGRKRCREKEEERMRHRKREKEKLRNERKIEGKRDGE